MFDVKLLGQYWPVILQGLPVTLAMTAIAVVGSILIGLLIALVKVNKVPVLRQICTVYVSFMRGVPPMVLLYMTYYGMPIIVHLINAARGTNISVSDITPFTFAVIAFTVQDAAYQSETIRAALLSVDKKEIEAAKSIGMTGFQTLVRVTLPQALIVAVPSFGNAITSMLKGTSLAFTIAVVDMMGKAKIIGGRNFHYFEAYTCAALTYWAICILIEIVTKCVEKKINFYNREIRESEPKDACLEGGQAE